MLLGRDQRGICGITSKSRSVYDWSSAGQTILAAAFVTDNFNFGISGQCNVVFLSPREKIIFNRNVGSNLRHALRHLL